MKNQQLRQALKQHRKGIVIASVCLAAGAGTAVAMHSYLREQTHAIEARFNDNLVPVVVAKEDLQPGTALGTHNLAARRIPAEFAQSSGVSPDRYEQLIGRTIAFPVKKGDAIVFPILEGPKTPTFSARVAKGRRAITVPVDDINSISGMLEPDDKIDLIASNDSSGQRVTYTLLQQVRVLATGQRTVSDPKTGEQRQFSTVTLDTSPEEAQRIISVRDQGRLAALLRNPQDTEDLRHPSASPSIRRAPAAPAAKREIPILYGGGQGQQGGGQSIAIRHPAKAQAQALQSSMP